MSLIFLTNFYLNCHAYKQSFVNEFVCKYQHKKSFFQNLGRIVYFWILFYHKFKKCKVFYSAEICSCKKLKIHSCKNFIRQSLCTYIFLKMINENIYSKRFYFHKKFEAYDQKKVLNSLNLHSIH